MKKTIFILASILLSVASVFAQDVICLVSGEYDSNKLPLDSILVENLSNETSILFKDLPEYELYQVNLTKGEFWGTVGINNFTDKLTPFKVLKSIPGQISLGYQKNEPTETLVSVFNINGQKVYGSNIAQINPGNTFNIQLSQAGVYFIRVETKTGKQTFKAIGSDKYYEYSVGIGNYQKSNPSTKSVTTTNNNTDFFYSPGDNVRFSVFKDGYIASPVIKSITVSENINFQFEINSTEAFLDPRDNNIYKIVKIGNQTWMAENLAYLPSVSPSSEGSKTEPYYYVYDNQETSVNAAKATDNYKTYGVLYNWQAALNACPIGWHLPIDDEWRRLDLAIGMSQTEAERDGWRGNNEGKKLKATSGWNNKGNGTDKYGFRALPGGRRHTNRAFDAVGNEGDWWSSTKEHYSRAWHWLLSYNYSSVFLYYKYYDNGLSVRCVKDQFRIETIDADNITQTTATIYGEITEDAGLTITESGFYYGTSTNVEISGMKIQCESETGTFNTDLTNLQPGTSYYFNTYAINEEGTDYGEELSFTTVATLPTVITSSATEITASSAIINGEITNDGGATITQRGFYLSTTNINPDSNDNIKITSGNTSTFSYSLSGLNDSTTYYYVAFATNSEGTFTGNVLSFTTYKDHSDDIVNGEFTDSRDGNKYKAVVIGDQTWMAGNLAYLPNVSPSTSDSYTDPHYYVYRNGDTDVTVAKAKDNYKKYGVLYNWPAAIYACPKGWHLPTDEEWKQLETAIGMSQNEADATGYRGEDEGKKLKATYDWNNDGNGTNECGFGGLPGSSRYDNGTFGSAGYSGIWWSATENGSSRAWLRQLHSSNLVVGRFDDWKEQGFSVRCVKHDNSSAIIPIIKTRLAKKITQTSATINGNVIDDGGATVTQRGFYWSVSNSNPNSNDNVEIVNGTTGEFQLDLGGLTPETTYYYKAFATNSEGTNSGNTISFRTKKDNGVEIVYGEFTDSRDDRKYNTVEIGSQTWMTENLAYLPSVSPSSEESSTEPYYYVYDYGGTSTDDAKATDTFKSYGVLYNWPAAKNACPNGWHLPTDNEWKQLEIAIGISQSEADEMGIRGEGRKLRTTYGWHLDRNGSDEYGFRALPSGVRNEYGNFTSIGSYCYWWSATSATDYGSSFAYNRCLIYIRQGVDRLVAQYEIGNSVRCVMD